LARIDLVSIKDYLTRKHSLNPVELPSENAERLVNYALDDCQGALAHMHTMSLRQKLTIASAVTFVITSIGLIIFDKIDWGLGILAIAVVLIIDILNAIRE
jgi:hypothetical protein